MKLVKKTLAFLLVFCMCFSVAPTAFAEGPEEQTKIETQTEEQTDTQDLQVVALHGQVGSETIEQANTDHRLCHVVGDTHSSDWSNPVQSFLPAMVVIQQGKTTDIQHHHTQIGKGLE